MMSKFKYLFTDLDDTVFDSKSLYDQAITASWEHLRKFYDIGHEDFKEKFLEIRLTLKENFPDQTISHNRAILFELLLEKYKIPFDAELILDLYNAYWTTVNIYIQPFPEVIDTLEKIKASGIIIVALSDGSLLSRLEKIDALKLSPYINYLVSSEEIIYTKPKIEIFKKALEKTGAQKKEVLFVGDNYKRDVVGGIKFGLATVWFNYSKEKSANCDVNEITEKPDFEINAYHEILDILGIN